MDGLELNDEALTVLNDLTGSVCSSMAGCTAAGLSLLRGAAVETVTASDEAPDVAIF